MEIATSFLTAKTAKEREEIVKKLNNSTTDYIHFDVADGKFVLTKNLCIPELVKLLKLSKKKNDVHLMVEDPIKYIEQIIKLNVQNITIHLEINQALNKILDYIKANNINAGLAVDINTNIDYAKPYFKKIDLLLLMTVKAGAGGQKFEERVLEKVRKIPTNIKLEFDGGINDQTIGLVNFGDIVVSGSYILKNIDENIENLRKASE